MKQRFVNGRYLGRGVTGVERFANMILREIDIWLQDGKPQDEKWTLLLPKGVEAPSWWNQAVKTVGNLQGHLWEQWDLARYTKRHGDNAILVNLCNSGPVWGGRSLTVIHDAMPYDVPENFRLSYRLLHSLLGHGLARHSRVATVSAFSRSRLAARLGLPASDIAVIYNAAEHVGQLDPDDSIIDRLDLRGAPFLLTVGSFAANKNLRTAIQAFSSADVGDGRLVLVGASGKRFSDNGFDTLPRNVVTPGRISDEALAALYRHAHALVFPSRYEGFGIPPLEALQLGCPVIASDIAPVREVCGNVADYFQPDDAAHLGQLMQQALGDASRRASMSDAAMCQASLFSWARSAQKMRTCIDSLD